MKEKHLQESHPKDNESSRKSATSKKVSIRLSRCVNTPVFPSNAHDNKRSNKTDDSDKQEK